MTTTETVCYFESSTIYPYPDKLPARPRGSRRRHSPDRYVISLVPAQRQTSMVDTN